MDSKNNKSLFIVLKPGKEQSLKRFHPWVFSGAISSFSGKFEEGDVVTVYSNKKEFLGIGHYQIGSIAVRIFSFTEVDPNENFWFEKIMKAISLRKALGLIDNSQTNVYRLVHGEGDNMPGLIIDFYNGVAVMQSHSIGMYRIKQLLAEQLKRALGDKLIAVYDKSAKTMTFKGEIQPEDGFIIGNAMDEGVVSEYNNLFKVNWVDGQKTGFFVDQRENRKLLQKYANGRKVLNMFCYTGGFSFFAMKGGATLVHSVDSSSKAIELTRNNVELNFPNDARHEAFVSDVGEFMKTEREKYDLIVLDPPAFAKHRNALPNALQAYKRLNARAIEQIQPGGILFTFSCSQVVTRENFREAVFSGAAIAGRNVKILHQLTQPGDHPINIYHPEGEYLKGLVLFVE